MALQSSGAISIDDIRTELGSSSGSLRTLSAAAGKSTPDAISEFYGYSSQAIPSVTTNAASSVTVTSVTLNGNVTSDNGATVTSRGFYFGTNSNVTSNPTYGSGSGTGSYSLSRTGLTGSTTYYFAAYATNAVGTAVGSTLSLTTQAPVALYNVGNSFNVYTSGPRVWGNTYYPFNNISLSSYNGQDGNINGYFKSITYHQTNHPNYGWTTNYSLTNIHGTNVNGSNISTGSTSQVSSGLLYYKSATGYNVENRVYVSGKHEENVGGGNSFSGDFCKITTDGAGYLASYNSAMSSDAVKYYSTNNGTAWGGSMWGYWQGPQAYQGLGGREGSFWTHPTGSSNFTRLNRSSYSYYLVTV
jgi:hypothetical protein